MKKIGIVITLAFLVAFVALASVSAALPGVDWWSAIFMQNIGSGDGSVMMEAYEDGLVEESEIFDFGYGQGLIYDPGKVTNYPTGPYIGFESDLDAEFQGSVVLSANVPIAAVSEIANYGNGTVGGIGTASARYQGMSMGMVDTMLTVPTIKLNYGAHTTTLYVQAAGADAYVTVTFNMNDGTTKSISESITANEMHVFDPFGAGVPLLTPEQCGSDSNTSPCYGSAVIESSSGPIAATVVEHPHQGTPAVFALSTRAQTPSDQDTKLYFPTIKNEYYDIMNAGASIMNVGDADALVQITLTVTWVSDPFSTASPGDTFTDTEVIAPGESVLFSKWLGNLGGMPKGTFAAAVVESLDDATYDPQPLVGATNDSKYLAGMEDRGITLYAGFADNGKTDKIAFPIVREMMGDISGGVTVQNVGSAPEDLTFEYYEYGSDNVYVFETKTPIAVGEAINTNRVSQNGATKFDIVSGFSDFTQLANKQFSVIVTADGGEGIIGLASEYSSMDDVDMRNYEGINFEVDDN